MVNRLFFRRRPRTGSIVLDPGCGTGEFIEGILRWCASHRAEPPRIVGVESDPKHVTVARKRFAGCRSVEIRGADFLDERDSQTYDFVVGNPPYVSILGLTESEKARYREKYQTAVGRFDLYLLFFEEALGRLKPGGRLVFITPEKFIYVETAGPLRTLLAQRKIEEIRLINEETFAELVTYPAITTLVNESASGAAQFILRDGSTRAIVLPSEGSSWLPEAMGHKRTGPHVSLENVCLRVSCGVATGADSVFVRQVGELDSNLKRFAYPTIAGRQLSPDNGELETTEVMLIPYDSDGQLLNEEQLKGFWDYLWQRSIRSKLQKRTCVQHKPWYAFHENPPLPEILRPKILCKDITEKPHFWIDRKGSLVPRHSVYYIVPKERAILDDLADYLNSEAATEWLQTHCQRAVNGFLRLQSHVLKRLPLPKHLANSGHPADTQGARTADLRASRRDTRTQYLGFAR